MKRDKYGSIRIETDEQVVEYYDIMFSGSDINYIKAEKEVVYKDNPNVQIYYKAYKRIPQEWIERLGITNENFLDVWYLIDETLKVNSPNG